MVNLNNIDNLYALKEEFSNAIDKFITNKRLEEKINSFKNLGFSDLLVLFEGVSETILNNKNGKKIVKEYVKLMKESASLNKAYSINKLINSDVNTIDNEMLIKESFELCKDVNLDDYKKDLSKLSGIVSEAIKISEISVNEINTLLEAKSEVLNSVDYLFENRKTFKNISQYVENMSKVTKYLNENISKNVSDKIDSTISINDVVKGINESADIAEDEWKKDLIERITLSNLANKPNEELFNEYKSECLDALKRVINEDGIDLGFKSKMLNMETKLSDKKYNEETFNEDVSNLAELKNTLLESWQEK